MKTEHYSSDTDLQVFVKWTDFLKWLLDTTGKFPRNVRYTITNRIDNLALDILEHLIECRYEKQVRASKLGQINIKLEKMRILLRICHENQYIPIRQFEHAIVRVNEAGKMIRGWMNTNSIRGNEHGEEDGISIRTHR